MSSLVGILLRLLTFVGFREEPPPSKNIKRKRVYDEPPRQQMKRFRSQVVAIDNCVKDQDDHQRLTKNGPSSPQKKTDIKMDVAQNKPEVAWVQSKSENTKKNPYLLHVDLDDDDSQQRDDVVIVDQVTRPPEHVLATNRHAACLKNPVFSKVLQKKKSNFEHRERLRRIANTIKPMFEDTLDASFRLPKTKQMNIAHEIKLDNNLNVDTYKNGFQEQDPIRVYLTDSSDSDDDVQVVPLESLTISSMTKDSKANLAELSRNLLLEVQVQSNLNNKLPKKQTKINDTRRVSDITSKVNSVQHEATKYFSTLLKTPKKLNDVDQNKVQSYKPNIATAGLSRLESINEPSLVKSHEKNNDMPQDSKIVSKVNTVQSEAKLNTTKEFLARLKADNSITPTKTQDNVINSRHESIIVPKVQSKRNDISSYLPAASTESLLEFDAKYNTTPQKYQEEAKRELNNVSKVNGEDRSPKLDSTDEWIANLKSHIPRHQNEENGQNDASGKSVIVTNLISKKDVSYSYKPETARKTLSKSISKPIAEQPKMQQNLKDSHQKVNSEQNEDRSLKCSEAMIVKLNFLYNELFAKTEESDLEMQYNVDLPALTPEQEKMVDRAFEPEPEDEMLVEKFNMRIHRRDLQTLSDLNWLNDEVINFYMNLIMQRSEEQVDLPKVYATNTFFYPKFMQGGQAGLRRWTRKVDIFAYDLFMVPVNIDHHWCLSIVDFRERIIKYLDSHGKPNQDCLDALLQYLKDEHHDKKGTPFDVSGWNTKCVTDIPQQKNSCDCGMFACTFAEFSSRGAAYSFTQAHMPYLRRKAALEILMGKLLL